MAVEPAVAKCISALESAKNDTEKLGALFLVTKVVKGKVSPSSRVALFNAIGFKFLVRLLKSPPSDDAPPLLCKSIALSILSAFCSEPSIAESSELHDSIPIFLKILTDAKEDEEDDQMLMIISETYNCLKAIAGTEKGKIALAKTQGIKTLAELYLKQSFNSDEGLCVIKQVGISLGPLTFEASPETFTELMDRLALQFEADDGEHKFELVGFMAGIVPTCNVSGEAIEDGYWPKILLKALVEILSSKLGEKQRNPSLQLASSLLTTLGVDWMIRSGSEEEGKAYQFLVLLVHLSCIEVRMGLEDRTVEKVLPIEDLIAACYAIIETTVRFMAGNHFENLEEKQKEQVYHSLKGAFSAIVNFINLLRKESETKKWDGRRKLLAIASVRVLASWIADESQSMKDEIFRQLPFVLKLVFESFEEAENNMTTEEMVLAEQGKSIEPLCPDTLCMLLPALCHLTAEEKGVCILLEAKGEEILFKLLSHNWSVYKNLKEALERKSRPGKKKPQQSKGPEINYEKIQVNLLKVRTALNNTCNLFINMTVLDPELVSISQIMGQVMRWAFGALPCLSSSEAEKELVLLANTSALGLLLLLHVVKKAADAVAGGRPLTPEEEFISSRLMSGADNGVFRFGQAVTRFVWDAHLPDESQSPPALILTNNYRIVWGDVKEMWFLSLQTVGGLFEILPWLGDFGAESGFLDALMTNLSVAYKNRIDSSTLAAYEDFLCAGLKAKSPAAVKIIREKGIKLATSHHLKILGKLIRDMDFEEKVASEKGGEDE